MLASLIAGLASGETALAVRRARRAAIAYGLAAMGMLCGLGFLIAAFYIWLAGRYGPLEAALCIGAGFIVLSALVVLVHRLMEGGRKRREAERRKSDLKAVGIATAIAVLPGLLRSKAGLGAAVVAPALAMLCYAIYRENSGGNNNRDPDRFSE